MSLSNDLISQFVKITNDSAKKKTEKTVYGTTVEQGGSIYVRFDGSTILTPVKYTASIGPNERVIVQIKNHTATVIGNLTSPSARVISHDDGRKTVEDIDLSEFGGIGERVTIVEQLVADKVSTDVVEAISARIDTLSAEHVTINGKIAANEGDISELQADNVSIKERLTAAEAVIKDIDTENLDAKYAKIEDLDATNADIYNLEATYAEFVKTTTESLEADKASIKELEADNVTIKGELDAAEADIDNLQADNVTVKGKLEANEGDISKLKTDKLDATTADIKYATIDSLNAAKADISELEADNVTINNKLTANEGDISKLKTDKLDATTADIKYATIDSLNVEKGRINDLSVNKLDAGSAVIKNLQSDVADIDTLIFGSASGSTIQTSFANAVIAQLGNAQIKSAMIDTISASKITAGDINTNNVRVVSEDGKLVISDETIQISDDTRVRVQIGKDASNDYSINIWDADGKLMFSKGGITDAAIKDAIIRNNMVSDDANISAKKLDIDSLFEEVNGSSKTIKSSKIMLDDKNQTLDVAFTNMTSSVASAQSTADDAKAAANANASNISTQGTQISAIQGQISSKVWQQDIETEIDDLSLGGRNLIAGTDLDTVYSGVADTSTGYSDFYSRTTINPPTGTEYIVSFDAKADAAMTMKCFFWSPNTTLTSESSTGYKNSGVTDGYATVNVTTEWKRYWVKWTQTPASTVKRIIVGRNETSTMLYIRAVKLEAGNKATDWTPAPEDVEGDITSLNTKYSEVKQTVDGITTTVASHTTELSNKAGKGEVTAVSDRVTQVETNLEGFKSTVSSTYTTKEEFNNLEIGGRNYVLSGNKEQSTSALTMDYALSPDYMILSGETVTVSFEAKAGPDDYIHDIDCYLRNMNGSTSTISEICSLTADYRKFVSVLRVKKLDSSYKYTLRFRGNAYVGSGSGMNPGGGTYIVRNVKLEKGNKATDWTPAPEDVESDISALTTRVSTAETSITQNKAAIELRATKTEVTKAVNDISVGGRNFLLNTGSSGKQIVFTNGARVAMQCVTHWTNYSGHLTLTCSTTGSELYYRFMTPGDSKTYGLETGTYYTISGKAKVTTTSGTLKSLDVRTQHVTTSGSSWAGGIQTTITTSDTDDWVPFVATLTTPETLYAYYASIQLYFTDSWSGVIELKDLKFEKGNKATDWTPAPEDNYTKTETDALIKVESDKISAAVTEIEGVKSRTASLELTSTNLTTKVTNAQSAIDNLSIGGRNLLLGSREFARSKGDGAKQEETHLGFVVRKVTTAANDTSYKEMAQWNYIQPESLGATYTFSFYAKGTVTSGQLHCYFYGPNGFVRIAKSVRHDGYTNYGSDGVMYFGVTSEWKRYSVTWTLADTGDLTINKWPLIRLVSSDIDQELYVCAPKLELGTRATDWSPAPEDLETRMNNAETKIDQNADNITLRALKTDVYTKSETQALIKVESDKISSVVSDVSGLNSRVSIVEQTANGLSVSLSDTTNRISAAESNINTIGTRATNAAKTATNFLDYDSTNGLRVGNKINGSWQGCAAQILPSAFNILASDGTTLASYGVDTIDLGMNSTDAVINMCGGMGTIQTYSDTLLGDTHDFLQFSGEHIRLLGKYTAGIQVNHSYELDGRVGAQKGWVRTRVDGVELGTSACTDIDPSTGDGVWTTQTIDITANAINMVADYVYVTGRYRTEISTVDGDITIKPGLGGHAIIKTEAGDIELNAAGDVLSLAPIYISADEKTAYNDGVAGWYLGTDGTAHVTHATTGSSINFHYGGSIDTTSIIRETESGTISINGMRFGTNKILWSGEYWMRANQTINLSESISDQTNGVVLVFCAYHTEGGQNHSWSTHFIPKAMITNSLYGGGGQCFLMSGTYLDNFALKYLYIYDSTINGHANNEATGTGASGIAYANNK